MNHWEIIEKRYVELTQLLSDPSGIDRNKRCLLQKELAQLTEIVEKRKMITELGEQMVVVARECETEQDTELRMLFEGELESMRTQKALQEAELDAVMIIPDEYADRSVYLEIRGGTGGQEAALFAGDLAHMYSQYAQSQNWKVQVESASPTDLGGYREIILHIKGKGVYGHLKHESGVHRVQRVPATETSGRVHTSTATVAVLPEADEVDVVINPADIRVDVFRASGAGGQHVNTTDSAVRITHIPSGTVVSCQDERSQHKNKTKAMKILQSRVLAKQVEDSAQEMAKKRRELVGGGMRAEKVRTYNFPQNRVTDHQVNLTLNKLDLVITGALGEIIDALRAQEHEHNKSAFLEQFSALR